MYQNSVDDRLSALRSKMLSEGIAACLIPSADPHQSEYVAAHWMCRQWISGFTGSAGTAVVTPTHAGLWTDSRYFIQAEAELASSSFELHKQVVPGRAEHEDWLLATLKAGDKLCLDGRLISSKAFQRIDKRFKAAGIELVTDLDLLGAVWEDRPSLPRQPIFEHELAFAGIDRLKKIQQVRGLMAAKDVASCLLTALDDIAWLFNLRGSDVEFNPVFYAYAILEAEQALLFVDASQVPAAVRTALEADGIQLRPYKEVFDCLKGSDPDKKLLLDPQGVSVALHNSLPQQQKEEEGAIVAKLKASKNDIEAENIRLAMEKDGVALVRLFMWLEKAAPAGNVTEYQVSEKLIEFRSQQENYIGESFPAISSFGPNGAIVHYRPSPAESATLQARGLFLLDCGAQYLDGTTDITRTISLGTPTAAERAHYTLVLKGHIDLAMAHFPEGTSGHSLDALARMPLWRAGLNYGHGTGHGVGFFLNVHEGPQGIHQRPSGSGLVPIAAGMVTSNEPGYYKQGAYGIRIENLVLAVSKDPTEYGNFLGFETLSLFPMEWPLIESGMLSPQELEWLDVYHSEVYRRLSPRLEREEMEWLRSKCFW